MNPCARCRVSNLIMILNEVDEGWLVDVQGGLAAVLLLPSIPLALIEVSVCQRRSELLWPAFVVGIIRVALPGQSHHRTVMKVVVPQTVQTISALFDGPNIMGLLGFVFGDHDQLTPSSRFSRAPYNF